MALGRNVKIRREQLDMTQSELAKSVGVSQVAIANLEKRDSNSSRNLTALSRALGVTPNELENGLNAIMEKGSAYDLDSANQQTNFVPVISWVQAGEFNEAIDVYQVGYSDEQVARINGGGNVYALYVRGDSMTAPAGVTPSFPEGYIIHVDPEQTASNGDCVIARIKGQDLVSFKQLKIDEKPYLKPLNPNHPNIFNEFEILGKVIGASIKL